MTSTDDADNPDLDTAVSRSNSDDAEPRTVEAHDGSPPVLVRRPHSRLGPYELLRPIGHGGQGQVWLALDHRLGRNVAIKLLSHTLMFSERARRRFLREADIAARLEHPGICAVHDAGEIDDVPYIAMQYVDGESLAQWLRRRADPEDAEVTTAAAGATDRSDEVELTSTPAETEDIVRFTRFLEDVARSLDVAHEAGLVHRDVKPGNVMITKDGRPVLLDFGLARDDDGETLTATGAFLGTPAYMAPELLRGARRPDRRVDVYALGVTLFETLAGRRPFRAPTRERLFRRVLDEDPPSLRKINAEVSEDLEAVIETALEKNPDRRYQNARAFADDLRAAREGRPVSAKPLSTWRRGLRWAGRHPAAAALIIALAIGLSVIAGLGTFLVSRWSDIRAAEETRQRERVEEWLETGFTELAEGDVDRAMTMFDRVLDEGAEVPEAVAGMVIAWNKKKVPAEGLAVLDRHPDLTEPHPLFARLRYRLEHPGTKPLPERITSLQPASTTELFVAGLSENASGHQGNIDRHWHAWRFLDRAVQRSRQARALYHYERAHAIGHVTDVRRRSGEIPGAVRAAAYDAAEALVELWPGKTHAWFWAAFALGTVDPDRSIEYANVALDRTDDGIERRRILHNMGVVRMGAQDYEAAAEIFERVIDLGDAVPPSFANLSLCFIRLDRLSEALDVLDRLRTTYPHGSELRERYNRLGDQLYDLGMLDEAERAYRAILEVDPKSPMGPFGIAVVARSRGDFDGAVPHLRRSVELGPDFAEGWFFLAQTLAMSGHPKKALPAMRKADELGRKRSRSDWPYPSASAIGQIEREARLTEEYDRWSMRGAGPLNHQATARYAIVPRRRRAFREESGLFATFFDHHGDDDGTVAEAASWPWRDAIVAALRFAAGEGKQIGAPEERVSHRARAFALLRRVKATADAVDLDLAEDEVIESWLTRLEKLEGDSELRDLADKSVSLPGLSGDEAERSRRAFDALGDAVDRLED